MAFAFKENSSYGILEEEKIDLDPDNGKGIYNI
jgi:hypothetical protein